MSPLSEEKHWDTLAKSLRSRSDQADQTLDSSLPPLQRIRLETAIAALGDVRGKKILVCGCGKGIETFLLIDKGANVVTFDIAHQMCVLNASFVRNRGVVKDYACFASKFEELPLPEHHFDLAFGVDVLHHLEDPGKGSQELRYVLKPGGRCIFIETWAGNPLFMFARDHLAGRYGIPHFGSPRESPLDRKRWDEFHEGWEESKMEFPIVFILFKMVDNLIIGQLNRIPDRSAWSAKRLTDLWRFSQSADLFLSHHLPEKIKQKLSYVCQIRLVNHVG